MSYNVGNAGVEKTVIILYSSVEKSFSISSIMFRQRSRPLLNRPKHLKSAWNAGESITVSSEKYAGPLDKQPIIVYNIYASI